MLTIFLQEGAFTALTSRKCCTEKLKYRDAVIEVVGLPLRCVFHVNSEEMEVRLCLRDEALSDSTCYFSATLPVFCTDLPEISQPLNRYVAAMQQALMLLQEREIKGDYVFLEASGKDLRCTKLTARSCPALSCYMFSGGVSMMRPYYDGQTNALSVNDKPHPDRQYKAAIARYEESEAWSIVSQDGREEEETPQFGFLWALSDLGTVFDLDTDTAEFTDAIITDERNILCMGDAVKLKWTPENPQIVFVESESGMHLGQLSAERCFILAPMLARGLDRAISAEVCGVHMLSLDLGKVVLNLKITISYGDHVQCTVCKLAGDQIAVWTQELSVQHSAMPLADAKAFFELYNRFNREYDQMDAGISDTSYAGLDNLEEEITAARKKMQEQRISGLDYSMALEQDILGFGDYVLKMIDREPGRYGSLGVYEIMPYSTLEEILDNYALGEARYYWLDQTRVSETVYNAVEGNNHWYSVLELYGGKEIPVDLQDEDVVSIFGCGCFEAFADLSYGC